MIFDILDIIMHLDHSKLYDWIIQIDVWAKIDYEILDEKCGNSAAVAPQMDDLFDPPLLTIITLKL